MNNTTDLRTLLKQWVQELNKVCDQCAECVKQAEAFFKEIGLGLTLAVQFGAESDHSSLHYMRRRNGEFGICVSFVAALGEKPEMRDWGQCPRDVKIAAAAALPRLISMASSAAKRAADAAEAALKETEAFFRSQKIFKTE